MQEITKETVLEALNKLNLDGMYGSWPKDGGICAYVYAIHSPYPELNTLVDRILKPVFAKWPKYSGNSWYPVPHPNPVGDEDEGDLEDIAQYAFEDEYADEMWSGEYGALRKELLAFCIEQLGKELSA